MGVVVRRYNFIIIIIFPLVLTLFSAAASLFLCYVFPSFFTYNITPTDIEIKIWGGAFELVEI